jgi:rhodanese-related sulfurtransferase
MTSTPTTDVDPATAQQMISDGKVTLIDVREDDEWAAGHAPHATHTPLGELDPAVFRADQELIAVCRTGGRSGKATDRLRAAGLTVHNLTGGMHAWAEAGLPVRRSDGTPGTVA